MGEKYLFKKDGICRGCGQIKEILTSFGEKMKWCNCDTKRFLEESKIIGYHKNPNELSMNEKLEFKKDGFCHGCGQIKETQKWCNCDAKTFLEERKIIGYHNKPGELSEYEKQNFKEFGFCYNCNSKQLKTNYKCKICNYKYVFGICPDCRELNTGMA